MRDQFTLISLLRNRHRLPITEQIEYKLCTLGLPSADTPALEVP